MHVSLEYPTSGEKQHRTEPVLVQNSGHTDDDTQISALDAFSEIDCRKSRHIKEVLGWFPEDAGDLRGRELNELVGNMTALNALDEKFWKSEKGWKSEKSNSLIVMRKDREEQGDAGQN